VRNEEVRQAEGGLQVLQEIEDLRLDGDVEGRHRLVAEEHPGLQGECPRDAEPLPLSAREGMRVAAQRALVEADHLEELLGARIAAVR
jgi:hypothetical protein